MNERTHSWDPPLDIAEKLLNLDKDDRNLEIYLKNPQKIEDQKEIVQKIFKNEFLFNVVIFLFICFYIPSINFF